MVTSLTREDVHNRIKEMMLILSPQSKFVVDDEGEASHFADDLDLLKVCIMHEMLDKEVTARQAYQQGLAQGRLEG